MSLPRGIWLATGVVSLLGLVAEVLDFAHVLPPAIAEAFSLSYEQNVPTWYASSLLLACAVAAARAAPASFAERRASEGEAGASRLAVAEGDENRVQPREQKTRGITTPRRWRALSAVFVFMSLDEAIEIHEHLGGLIAGSGVLFFSWVIPASAIVLVLGLWMVPLLRALDAPLRRRVIASGAIYVGGALLMELPLGWWTEQHGDDNLVYGLIDFVEETLELVGATLFFTTVWRIPESYEA